MVALLHNAALVDDGNLVGVANRRQSVSNHNRRALVLVHQIIQGSLNHLLALVVKRTRRLVQQQNFWILDHRPRNRHPLLLPPRQLASLLTNVRVVPLGELHDEGVRVGHLRRRLHLLPRRPRLAAANVVGNSARKQHGLLPYQPDLLTEPPHVELFQVRTIQRHTPAVRVVEPLHQRHRRALAAP